MINEEEKVTVLKQGKSPILTGEIENGKINWQKDNNLNYLLGTYTIKGYRKESNTIEVLVTLKSDSDIDMITFPDKHSETYSQKEVQIDYEVMDGQKYEFIAQTNGKTQIYVLQTAGTTVGNPINSKESLREIAQLVNLGCDYENKTITLAKDISLDGSQDNQWIPIGNETNKFKGTFDGNEKVISSLYINSNKNYQALFGWNSGTVKNITIANGTIISNSVYAAGLVAYNDGTIENAHNQSCIVSVDNANGEAAAGGICSNNNGTIMRCSNLADISSNTKLTVANANAGGITGVISRNKK